MEKYCFSRFSDTEVYISIYPNENKDPYVVRVIERGVSTFRTNYEELVSRIIKMSNGKVNLLPLYEDPFVHQPEWEIVPLPKEEYKRLKTAIEQH